MKEKFIALRRTVYRYVHRHLASRKFSLIQAIHPKYNAEKWNLEYKEGRWEVPQDAKLFARMGVAAAYFRFFKKGGHFLEIGCGTGEMPKSISFSDFQSYTGIDVSEMAIHRAKESAGRKEVYICADARTYIPKEKLDIVFFSECLNYFDDPLGILRRYQEFLVPDGTFIISMYETMRSEAVWAILDAHSSLVDSTIIYKPEEHEFFRISAIRLKPI